MIKHCCGSETFISDPISDPDPAFSEFRIRFRIRIRIRIQILDLNPDQKTAKKLFFLNLKNKLLELDRHYEIWQHSRPQIFLDRKYFYRAFLSHAS